MEKLNILLVSLKRFAFEKKKENPNRNIFEKILSFEYYMTELKIRGNFRVLHKLVIWGYPLALTWFQKRSRNIIANREENTNS